MIEVFWIAAPILAAGWLLALLIAWLMMRKAVNCK